MVSTHAESTAKITPTKTGVRIVAIVEAAKGALVLIGGFGLLTLLHRDVQAIAIELIGKLHMNPSKHYPTIFIDAASRVNDARLWELAWFALVYSLLRLVEAYGLWRERRWAEWVALVSGGIYLPIEIFEVMEKLTWFRVGALVTNLIVVGCMVYALCHPSRAQKRPV